ncbi:MAG TPA: HEPN domain-containing protein [Methanoregulaceae archaeon]|nr:HEPN domain-containing protein [Methanoregulaceae archaeon]
MKNASEKENYRRFYPLKKRHGSPCLTARENFAEAEEAVKVGLLRAATNSAYVAVFHAARAVLFRDGIREKSHFCLEQYLNTYVDSGKLESKWVAFFGNLRSKRDINQYGFEPPATREELDITLQLAAQFIDRMGTLLKI